MSAELVCMDATAARALTDRMKTGVAVMTELIKEAYQGRVWDALGYASWDEYVTREFGAGQLRIPKEERTEYVASLRESGMSIRAIASATGVSTGTVRNELASTVQNCTVDQEGIESDLLAEELIAAEPVIITGTNGKNYSTTPSTPKTPRRKPITESFDSTTFELKKVVERAVRLTKDDRFTKNKDQISGANLSDLVRVRDALNGVISQLEG